MRVGQSLTEFPDSLSLFCKFTPLKKHTCLFRQGMDQVLPSPNEDDGFFHLLLTSSPSSERERGRKSEYEGEGRKRTGWRKGRRRRRRKGRRLESEGKEWKEGEWKEGVERRRVEGRMSKSWDEGGARDVDWMEVVRRRFYSYSDLGSLLTGSLSSLRWQLNLCCVCAELRER